jgi:hypothetical protein
MESRYDLSPLEPPPALPKRGPAGEGVALDTAIHRPSNTPAGGNDGRENLC